VELEIGVRCQPCHRHRHLLPGEIHVLTQKRVQGKGTSCTDAIRQLTTAIQDHSTSSSPFVFF
jgi:hypothetical protein